MFVRKKKSGTRTYVQIVGNKRVSGKVKQTVYCTLGRLEQLQEEGKIEQIMNSLEKFSTKSSVISEYHNGEVEKIDTCKIGAPLLFSRIWKRLQLDKIIEELLKKRNYEFPVERAIFVAVLHGLIDPCSDRAANVWHSGYRIEGAAGLDLQHFYRAIAWLGEPLPEKEQKDATSFAPRCVKDQVEEAFFEYHRDLFTELNMVFFDTTSIYFEGQGGETIGQYGNSKDNRPDLKQMIVGVVLDSGGRPICCEIWPGNTTDVKTLLPVVDRLRNRFSIKSVCVISDRGMISKETMKVLESETGTEYILGVRMRKVKEIRKEVLTRAGRFKEVFPGRKDSMDPSPLKVKEVRAGQKRYIVCYNKEQAAKDRHDREAILESLRQTLKRGDKSLVGNRGYRKFLKTPGKGGSFTINEEKIAEEEKYDGKWVLTTTTDFSAEETALKYKQLWMVESAFRGMKDILGTRPVYHKTDETIRGHVFCRFLGLVLLKSLQENLEQKNMNLEWEYFKRDLERLEEIEVIKEGKRFILRSDTAGDVGKVFQAAGAGLPPSVRFIEKEAIL